MPLLDQIITGYTRRFSWVGTKKFWRGKSRSPKHLPPRWYKGRGCRSLGRHTRRGGYILQKHKMPQVIVPDLTDFKLLPYVSHQTPLIKDSPPTVPQLNIEDIEPGVDLDNILYPKRTRNDWRLWIKQQKKQLPNSREPIPLELPEIPEIKRFGRP
eukprot:TRINITY_DN7672_c0_g1_i1.p1 TRINITY_DN7672_c0_g1~~TRINITY_DN7672_c0_g1_i1.p1  ORF type:complete len:156 (+),score=23.60 TRINITY_DN7672_c0_g1_i1:66-533(+)